MTSKELANLLEAAKVVALQLQVMDIQKRMNALESIKKKDTKPKIWPALAGENE